ncbi:MAG: NAD-dependent deacylase [Thauera sp.]|jgi:NAD-dependent deacetylase|nr:NAD-dependent deacylase [Thauera sp.]
MSGFVQKSPELLGAADAQRVLQQTAELFAAAERILFITGAGISADSGLPTYRGFGGLYDDRVTEEGYAIEEVLSGPMLARHPALSWKYLAEIEARCRGAQPNLAHRLLAALEREKAMVCVLTQNVDGLHAAAGSRNLIEIHGSLHRLRCADCGNGREVEDYSGLQLPPECPRCSGLLRPDVVLFGEQLEASSVERLEHVLQGELDLVVSIGTTSVFPYIAGPMVWAARAGIPTVEINPGESEVSSFARHRLAMGAATAMAALWQLGHDGELPAD